MLLQFNNVFKCFGTAVVIDDIRFSVAPGEFFTLLGPSGCGKTTTLGLLARLEAPDAGEIILEGRHLAAPERAICLPPDKRVVGGSWSDTYLRILLPLVAPIALAVDLLIALIICSMILIGRRFGLLQVAGNTNGEHK